jgi:hypothetical protein
MPSAIQSPTPIQSSKRQSICQLLKQLELLQAWVSSRAAGKISLAITGKEQSMSNTKAGESVGKVTEEGRSSSYAVSLLAATCCCEATLTGEPGAAAVHDHVAGLPFLEAFRFDDGGATPLFFESAEC